VKSKFAKFIDRTIGAALIFIAATAVFAYFTTLDLALFSATAVTACVFLMLGVTGRRKDGKLKISRAADDMFFAFLFAAPSKPARLLCRGLTAKGLTAAVHGDALYVGKTAAFFAFDAAPSAKAVARMVSRAAHYGAEKIIVFCKTPFDSAMDLENIQFKTVYGDDVYRLFASLGCLPEKRFETASKKRRIFAGALSSDKIVRYFILACAMSGVAALSGFSPVAAACAAVSAALCIAAIVYNAVKAAKSRKNKPNV